MGKRGPTAFSPDWDQVDKMSAIQLTGEEIAKVLDVSYNTLERAFKRKFNDSFGEWLRQKRTGLFSEDFLIAMTKKYNTISSFRQKEPFFHTIAKEKMFDFDVMGLDKCQHS